MGISIFNRILKVEGLPEKGQELVKKFVLFSVLANAMILFSSTFFVLHVIDIVDFASTGKLYALMFLVIALTDYPTGSLVNRFEHRIIMFISFIVFGLSFILLAISNSIVELIIVFILLGVANSQLSGTLQSWYENNYNVEMVDHDPQKLEFKEIQGRFIMIIFIVSAFTFVVGGSVASIFSEGRKVVFLFQGIGSFGLAVLFLVGMINSDKIVPKEEHREYLTEIKQELSFIFSDRVLSRFIIGQVIMYMALVVFDVLIVFPLYYGYTGSDFGAGILRFSLFLILGFYSIYAGKVAKTLSENKWIPYLGFLTTTIAFSLTSIMIFIFPVKEKLDLIPLILLIIIFLFHGATIILYNILVQKLYIDLIPDIHRNGFYSLIPTLGLLLGTPLILIMGSITENYGIATTMLIVALVTVVGNLAIYLSMRIYEHHHLSIEVANTISENLSIQNFVLGNIQNPLIVMPTSYKIYNDAHQLLHQLIDTAMIDGHVTNEEKRLISTIMENVDTYGKLLEYGVQDNIISQNRLDDLMQFRKIIMETTIEEALSDSTISEDESKLLFLLLNIIQSDWKKH